MSLVQVTTSGVKTFNLKKVATGQTEQCARYHCDGGQVGGANVWQADGSTLCSLQEKNSHFLILSETHPENGAVMGATLSPHAEYHPLTCIVSLFPPTKKAICLPSFFPLFYNKT